MEGKINHIVSKSVQGNDILIQGLLSNKRHCIWFDHGMKKYKHLTTSTPPKKIMTILR